MKAGKICMIVLKVLLILFFIGAISFYLLIGVGLSSRLQTLWVTTAMTTMEHKWLATSIVSEKKIKEIIDKNKVDDSGYESEIITLVKENEPLVYDGEIIVDMNDVIVVEQNYLKYERQGYTKLEEGLYIKEVSGTGWRGDLMLVEDPLRVSIVDTPKQFVEGWTVKKMVESVGGIAGINGGGFHDGPNYDSNGGVPAGLLIENGVLVSPKKYDGCTYQMIGLNEEGVLVLKKTTAQWAIENGIKHAVCFGPYIIVNGEGVIKSGTGGWGIAPRTAMGQRETGEILFLVVDGRQSTWSIGVDLKVIQDVLLEEGCINAAMMDGGSSTVMVYNGEFVNKPSLGHERYINNAWVVK